MAKKENDDFGKKTKALEEAFVILRKAGFIVVHLENAIGTGLFCISERELKTIQVWWKKDNHHMLNAVYKVRDN